MSTPSKKKVTPKADPKYSLGHKLFTITHHKGQPEEIWEVKVKSRTKTENKLQYMTDPKDSVVIAFSYECYTPKNGFVSFNERELYPSFQQAANKFAESFLVQRPL
jgi:hypothetical protein